ncbi:hypothetical protein SLEP1_g27964 [Rubroshorea leprosula]|uniref:RNase H type-1 domain-containing protein n=1 Tax=Rubroshorea leprosula TaxID=152421 RepID=A0AAV5JS18_9ROSI|nr:hypothetical protein SLEP1_g27964 [Rubroshorea leprosula]
MAIRQRLFFLLEAFDKTSDIGKYLGIPISAKRHSKADCQFILEKIRSKLIGWKTQFPSMAGRATLISSVLASIPNFYMQTMWLPSSVHKEIDRISNNFLWGSTDNQRKIHSIGWDTVCLPKSKGGLGFRSARNANIVAMSKLNWRLHTEEDKAWREVLVRKYNINNFSFAPSSSASHAIKCISKGTELFKSEIKYIARNSHSISFWFDHWVGATPLRSILFGLLIENAESILLSDALSNGAFNMDAISYTLPSDLVKDILAIPLSNLPFVVDGLIGWDPPPPGWLKLNTNGSTVGNPNNASCGGLFKDYPGHWVISFTSNIGLTTALVVELYAIRDGLNIVVSHHFHSVIVEIDCQVAYLLLTITVNKLHPCSTLILNCRALLHIIPQVQVKDVLREANIAADALAKKRVFAPHGLRILNVFPPTVHLLCIANYVGVSYSRP